MSSDRNVKQPVTSANPMEALCINTIRTLSMDAVQQANSGHPGTPMALAPVAYCLWQNHLRYDPEDPVWPNRDRFVLSAGHASMLLYSLLHLAGVKAYSRENEPLGTPAVSLEDIKNFRQLHSKCPGHPEYRLTSGVETTTGPLGQGVANSVGMAMAGLWLTSRYGRPGFEDLFDFNVYAICSDGDLMEGISHEAGSLAGHLKLGNLCWIYDNNRITIEGNTSLAYSEDVAERFMAYGWHVTRVSDANDLELLERAFALSLETDDRPTLIIVDSHIAWARPTSRIPMAPTASPWAKTRSGSPSGSTAGPRTPSSWSPTASTTTSSRASVAAAKTCAPPGWPSSRSSRPSIPSWVASST